MAINIPTKNTGDQLTASEFNDLVNEAKRIENKVDKVDGKGLSTNDYTTGEKNKLSGLPGSVYSKVEVDNKLASATGNIISGNEVQVGLFQLAGPAGVVSNPVYSKFSRLLDLPGVINTTKEYTLSPEPLGCNLYFSIDSFVVSTGEKLKSEIFVSMYEIVKVHVDNDYNTKVVIKCKETTTLDLSAHLNVRYIKQHAEKLEIDITCASAVDASAVSVEFPALKFDKDTLVSYTTDDANTSSFSRVWAGINGRPVSNKFYHANQLEAGDIPASIVDVTLEKTLGYTDGCGNERRFAHGVAIWPYCIGNAGVTMMDSVSDVNPTANNTYRFMNPYLQWIDVAVMLKYGASMYYHNIGTEIFGDDKVVSNVVAGLKADCERAIDRVGRGIKVLARPDGNNTFVEAASLSDQILLTVGENSPAVDIFPFSIDTLFKKVALRFLPNTEGGTTTEQESVKSQFATEMAKSREQRKWFHFACHTATLDWVNLLVWFNDNYGKDGNDSIWFATLDEIYEYYHARANSVIRKSVNGNTLHLTVYLPKGQYFYYPDFTLLLSGGNITGATAVDGSGNVTGLSKVVKNGKLMVNVIANPEHVELAEEFTSKYETGGQSIHKTDALYFVGLLKESLKQGFIDRLNANPNAFALISMTINSGASSTTSRSVSIVPSYRGTPTYYRIGETSDLSAVEWIAYAGGAIPYSLSTGYGSKTVYLQLKDSGTESVVRQATINYTEASTEVLLTGLSIPGGSSVQPGNSLQLSVIYTPSNTTQTVVTWSSSNPSIATVNPGGLVTGVSEGNVVITVTSSVNPAIEATLDLSVRGVVVPGNVQFVTGAYSWSDYRNDKILDDTANIYLTIANENNNPAYGNGTNNIYDANTGELLVGYTRMSDEEKRAYHGLETLDTWLSSKVADTDMSSLFSTSLGYSYSSKYNASVYPVIGWNVPVGTYKVSILSSTSLEDTSATGHIKINNVEQVLPTLLFQNNTTWMEFNNIVVNDGKLAIMMWADKSKRIGWNAIKVEKIG